MKIAITAQEPSLESYVDPRFGRCAHFVVVDTETQEFEAIANPGIAAGSGAGIQAAQLIAERGAQFVLTGNCGPNAYQTLCAAGIGVIVGCSGMVKEVLAQFGSGAFQASAEPSVPAHFGLGAGAAGPGAVPPGAAGPGPTPGMGGGGGGMGGGGRGMGGGGRGMGGGGRGMGGGGRGMGGGGRGMGGGGRGAQ